MTKQHESHPSRGLLYMAASHIGNAEDTPLRTLKVLRECELLIFEEDRPARQLLKQAGIQRPYLKYNEHHPQDVLDLAEEALRAGKAVVYVSDQGCPTLADPGRELLVRAYASQAQVRVIPGPSSVTAAISACPFSMESFRFCGFLPAQMEKRELELESLRNQSVPLVILDTPYRLEALLASCAKVFGSSKKAFLALDITGEEEAYVLGNFKHLSEAMRGKKLNFVLIIQGKD